MTTKDLTAKRLVTLFDAMLEQLALELNEAKVLKAEQTAKKFLRSVPR